MISFVLATALLIPSVQPGTENRQPALASGDHYAALVFGNGESIWYAHSSDGEAFSKPVEIARVPHLMLGRHRGPRVAIAGDNVTVTAVSGGDVGSLLAWRSADQGATWTTQPVTINDEPHAAREGLHNLAASKDGTLAAVWLDLRVKGTRLYGSYSRDGGTTWAANQALYVASGGTICTCCHPSIIADGKHFEVLFRNVAGPNRDMYTMRWSPGSQPSAPDKQGDKSWNIQACPMDGGAMVVDKGQLMTAWRREHTVVLAEGASEQTLGDGKDVAAAASPRGPMVAWVSPTGSVLLHTPEAKAPVTLAPKGAYPALASFRNGGVLAAWEDGEAIAMQLLNP